MTNYEKQRLIAAIEQISGNDCSSRTIEDKQLYCAIITGLVTTKGYASKPEELKKKADELYAGIKCKNYYY